MGVIDAIADGCFAVARRPYLLIPPVALDLFYWLGDRLTAAPLIEALIRNLQQGGMADEQLVDSLRALENEFNLFSFLSFQITALVPALTPDRVARPWQQGVVDPGNWALVVLSTIVLGLAGLFCLALYLSGVAQVARDEPFDLRQIARRAPVCWLRLLGLGAVVVGGILLLGMPVFLLSGLLVAVRVNPGPLLALFILPLFWLYCFLALAPEAIVVSDVGPLKAIKLSVGVVRRNFWPVLGLLGATLLISYGFPLGWELMTRQVAGVPLAIVGNAYLGTGLAAAAMLFYRERVAALETAAEQPGERQQGPTPRP